MKYLGKSLRELPDFQTIQADAERMAEENDP